MTTGLGDTYKNTVLDYLFGGSPPSPPATVYLALYTVTPTDAGGGTEVTTAGGTLYARVAITNDTTNFPAASGGSQSNGVAFTFPTAGADWGTVVAFGYLDAPTGGSLIGWGALGTPVDVAISDTAQFAIGELVATAA